VVLSTLDVLYTFAAVICYGNKTCSLALARYVNSRFHMCF